MNLATAVRQAVNGSLAIHLAEPPAPILVDTISYDLLILAANRVEAPDSPLCNCDASDLPLVNRTTGQAIDHECDCTAVVMASRLLDGVTSTLHAEQCPGCE